MFNHALYTIETAKWRALLDLSSFMLNQRLPSSVEDYIVSLLIKRMHYPDIDATYNMHTDLKEIAEQCLLISGLFPEQPLHCPFSLRYFIDTGVDSYKKLAEIDPDQELYQLLAQRFIPITDVLHQFRALCIGQEILDPIQAYEVWLETGSHYAKQLLANASDGFPLNTYCRSVH